MTIKIFKRLLWNNITCKKCATWHQVVPSGAKYATFFVAQSGSKKVMMFHSNLKTCFRI